MQILHGAMPSAEQYLSQWERMLAEWSSASKGDHAWLLYSANYLLVTGGIRWAVDPLTLHSRVPGMPQGDISALVALDYILLTHRHADHLDMSLLRQLKEYPIKWIVPEFMLSTLQPLKLHPDNVIVMRHMQPIHLNNLTITPFDGLHLVPDASLPGGQRGVPAMGYLAEFNGKKWLFPGDTRVFDASRLPSFGPVDGLCMHVWLGKEEALNSQLPLLEHICRFCLDLQPKRILLPI
jgi:L-ascorbate metabolism protein UlaG (beta-lactamase superfamily)